MKDSQEARRHALATLRHRNFRLLWFGQLFSSTGLQMQLIVFGWHIYVLTDSPLQLGLIGLVRIMPFMLLVFAGGAIADLVDRRWILLASQATLTLISGLLAFATAGELIAPWAIYAAAGLSSAAFAFDSPSRDALIPATVPRAELSNALTLNSLVRKVANVLAPGVMGLAIAQLGLAWAYGLNAAAFAVVIGALLFMHASPGPIRGRAVGWELVVGGLRHARREPLVLAALALDFSVGLLANPWALLPVFARDVLQVGPQGLGLLHASASAGGVVAGVALGLLGGVRRPVAVMLATSAAQGLFVLGFGLSQVFTLSLLLLFGAGACNVVSEVLRATIVQLKTPDELRGRIMALSLVFTNGGPHFGTLQAGALASVTGPMAAVAIGGAAIVLGAIGFSQLPTMRRGVAELKTS